MKDLNRIHCLLWVMILVVCPGLGQVKSSGRPASGKAEALVGAAAKDLRFGDFDSAESALRKAISLGTKDPEAYNLLGLVCDQTKRRQEAISYYQNALRLEPNFRPARNNLGASFLARGELDQALGQFEQTLKLAPDDVTANYNIGVIRTRQGLFVEAISAFERAHKFAPNDASVLYELAGVQDRSGEPAKALKTLEAAYHLAPNDPIILLRLAQLQMKAGSYPDAMSAYDSLLDALRHSGMSKDGEKAIAAEATQRLPGLVSANPNSDGAKLLLAKFQFVGEDYQGALKTLTSVSESGRTADYFDLAGLSLGGVGQLQEAINALAEAVTLAPKRSDLLFHIGSIYQKAGDNQTAMKMFKRAIAGGEHSPQTELGLALSYFNFGNYREAIGACQDAVALSADFVPAYLLMGRSYGKLSQTKAAVSALRKSVTLSSNCEDCNFQLALALLAAGQTVEPAALLRKVIRINPTNASAHYELGKQLAKRGDNPGASREFEQAIALQPGYDQAYYQLGRVYLAMGEKTKAMDSLNAAKELKEQRLEAAQERLTKASKQASAP